MKSPILRYLFLLLATGWAIIIYFLSSQPGANIPPLFFAQDKLFHFIAFGILGFLCLGAMQPTTAGFNRRQVCLAIALVAAYGFLDEIHQHFVPGRVTDQLDMVADAAGGIVGVFMMYFLGTRRRQAKPEDQNSST